MRGGPSYYDAFFEKGSEPCTGDGDGETAADVKGLCTSVFKGDIHQRPLPPRVAGIIKKEGTTVFPLDNVQQRRLA